MRLIFIVNNITLLIGIVALYLVIKGKVKNYAWYHSTIVGLLFGIAGSVLLLFYPTVSLSTIIFGCALIIGISGFITGFIGVLVSSIVFTLGGILFFPSFGKSFFAIVFFAALLGFLFSYFMQRNPTRFKRFSYLLIFGLGVQLFPFLYGIKKLWELGLVYLTFAGNVLLFVTYSTITVLFFYLLFKVEKFLSTEHSLKLSEEKYRYLVERISGIIIKIDHLGRITYANNYALQKLGYTIHELIGKNTEGFLFKDECKKFNKIFDTPITQQSDAFCQFESEIVAKDGNKYWISWVCCLSDDSQSDQILEILCTGVDITDRKQAEIAQRITERKFRILHEGLLDSYVRVDTQGRIVDFNKAYLTLTGYNSDEITKLTYVDLTPEKWHNVEKDILDAQVFPNGYSDLYEKEYMRKDGTLIPIELRTYLITDSNGKFDGFWAIIRDISYRKEAERALKDANEKNQETVLLFESLLNTIPDMISVQNPDRSIVFYNKASSQMLGLTQESFKGKKCYELLGKTVPCNHCVSELVLESKKAESMERFIPEMNMWVESLSYPVLDSDGNIKFIIEHLHDITIRKNYEITVRQSENFYRNMVENSSLGILFFDLQSNDNLILVNSNSAASGLLAINLEKLHGQLFESALPFFASSTLLSEFKNVAKTGMNLIVDQYKIQVNDSPSFFEVRAFQSQPGRVVIILLDITQRINDRNALLLSEYKLRTVITENPLVFFMLDQDGIFTLSEGQGLSLLGLKSGEIVGQSVFEVYKDFLDIKDCIAKALKGESIKKEIKVNDLVFDTVFTPFYDDKSQVEGVLGVATDATARVKAEYEVKRKSDELERYFANSLDLLCIADKNGLFRKVNPEWGRLLGFDFNDLVGASFLDFLHPDDLGYTHSKLGQLTPLGEGLSFVNRFRSKIGDYYWIEWRVFLDDDLMYAVARDITERKIAEEKLLENDRQLQEQNEEYVALNEELQEQNKKIHEINEKLIAATEKAQESDRLKSAFLANMSHEIRTPMNGIMGFCQLLSQPNIDSNQIAKYVDIIISSGNQLLTIINDIIDISKIEAGQVTLNHAPVQINRIIKNAVSLFQVMAFQKKIRLINLSTSLQSITILSDEVKITQVLNNLINNAIKFTSVGVIEVGCQSNSKYIKIWVKDTGIGIATANQKMIFDRFRQVDGATSGSMKGTGLGLAISKSLVEMMGGEIWVESEFEKGSKFVFTLPNIQATEPTDDSYLSDSVPNKFDFGGIEILLAEDDQVNLILIRKTLENANAKVITVFNGLEAVEIVKKSPNIKLVLMDIKMPVMNGIDATRAIKEIRPELPVVAQTAYALSEERDLAIKAGCDVYLTKPININHLYYTIQNIIND